MSATTVKLMPDVGTPPATKTGIEGIPLKVNHIPSVNVKKTSEAAPVPVVKTEPVKPEPVVDEAAKRAARREEWTMAEKARQLDASATQKLKEAKAYEQALANFDKDPLALATALNVPVDALLRKLQGAAFNLPTDKVERPLTPDEKYNLLAMKYEQDMKKRDEANQIWKNAVIKENYINKHILPILNKDPDKYELIHAEGLDESADFIFGEVVKYCQEHNKQEPKAQDVVDAYEQELEKNLGAVINNLRGVKKFKSLFDAKQALQEAQAAVDQLSGKESTIKIPPAQIRTSNAPTEAEILANSGPKKKKKQITASQTQDPYTIIRGSTRDERLARVAEARLAREAAEAKQ